METLKLFNTIMDEFSNKTEQENFFKKFEEVVGKPVMQKAFYPMYTYLYGEHFNSEPATEAVQGMDNINGTKGETYTFTACVDAAEKLGLSWEKYNKFDWYFTLNMIASDYVGIVEDVKFVEIAKAWLEDKDVPEGKALRYWWKVVKCN